MYVQALYIWFIGGKSELEKLVDSYNTGADVHNVLKEEIWINIHYSYLHYNIIIHKAGIV